MDTEIIPEGLCQCGCSGKTGTYPITSKRHGWIMGAPRRFMPGHAARYASAAAKKTGARWKDHTLHPLYRTPIYTAWSNMKQRCLNPKYPQFKDYGGRGITICKSWLMFANFARDMAPRPDGLDRINNNRGYSRGNCQWATRRHQRLNSRPRALNPRDEFGRWAATVPGEYS